MCKHSLSLPLSLTYHVYVGARSEERLHRVNVSLLARPVQWGVPCNRTAANRYVNHDEGGWLKMTKRQWNLYENEYEYRCTDP